MPTRLKRFHESRQTHFITFSCYHRRTLFARPEVARSFELALERVRRSYGMLVYGYVVMPDHVHLLISEPQRSTLSEAIKALKISISRTNPQPGRRFWQTRYYDFNVRDEQKRVEKLRYIHRNPVAAKLCLQPADWDWSSFKHYSTGALGTVSIESHWNASRREHTTLAQTASNPMQATEACMGHPSSSLVKEGR